MKQVDLQTGTTSLLRVHVLRSKNAQCRCDHARALNCASCVIISCSRAVQHALVTDCLNCASDTKQLESAASSDSRGQHPTGQLLLPTRGVGIGQGKKKQQKQEQQFNIMAAKASVPRTVATSLPLLTQTRFVFVYLTTFYQLHWLCKVIYDKGLLGGNCWSVFYRMCPVTAATEDTITSASTPGVQADFHPE
jgi:hypothetical protein